MSTEIAAELRSLRERVETFIALEAELADTHRYDEWLELWSPDGLYWVPSNADDYDPAKHVSIIYDKYERLQERCFRLSVEGVHSQEPRSRLCRSVSNLQVRISENGLDAIIVGGVMILVEVRSGVKQVYGARLEYHLVEAGDSFKIRRKKVMLLDNDEPLGNLTFLL